MRRVDAVDGVHGVVVGHYNALVVERNAGHASDRVVRVGLRHEFVHARVVRLLPVVIERRIAVCTHSPMDATASMR